jgi:hypothetical protein
MNPTPENTCELPLQVQPWYTFKSIGRHYKDVAIFRYSSSVNARHVRVRMFPAPPWSSQALRPLRRSSSASGSAFPAGLPHSCNPPTPFEFGTGFSPPETGAEKTVGTYVQLNDREALEDLRTYRQKLAVHLKAGLDFSFLIHQIDAEIAVIQAGRDKLAPSA